ncbi:MAG: phosphatidate cytidylyltransferase [Candidatus Saccharibacteria bacterium]|nr:phosphatidate cytidylyltransferase [Candidatus Saccharibacteria bacterium]
MDNYVQLSYVLLAVLVLGTLACLPFYGWNVIKLIRSDLFVKCIMWIPIYLVFTLIVFSPYYTGVIAVFLTIAIGSLEFHRQTRKRTTKRAIGYLLLFIVMALCMAGLFIVLPYNFRPVVVAVGISSAMSDVFAFFSDKFLGSYKLPKWISPDKSWQGVIGQIIGGTVGMLIVIVAYQSSVPLTLAFGVIIGCASALGDIANSIAKRSLKIKDWSHAIPGHGGFLDRFSSLMAAFAVAFLIIV